ncbi:MAG: TetR/AcrR family transcriptional regulator [Gemmatimonadaceae bacterium]|nr:TetR/AcrR family transcriptional regulator [Gemmatimonadaceae bacterium]
MSDTAEHRTPSRIRRDREKADTRQRILEAARELFTNEGYAQTSMRRIADQIGYTATAIYHHFQDKDSLLNELCAVDFSALGEALRTMEQIPDPVTRLRLMGQNYVRFALDHPQQFRFMFLVERPIPGPECVTIDPAEDSYQVLIANVREAIAAQRFRPEFTDAEMVAQILWSGVHGLAAIHLHSPEKTHPWLDLRDPDKTAAALTDVVLRGLLREPAA